MDEDYQKWINARDNFIKAAESFKDAVIADGRNLCDEVQEALIEAEIKLAVSEDF